MRSSTQKYNLGRLLHAIKIGALSEFSQDEINYELLRLMLSYARSIHRINLRTQWEESFSLSMLTLKDLGARKGRDPTLNKAYDELSKRITSNTKSKEDLILEMAERILNGTAARNAAISKLPRIRTKHALKNIMREVVEDHPQLNHQILRGKAILIATNEGLIDRDDEENKQVIFKDERTKTITYGTIEKWAKDLKSNLDLTG